MPPLETRITLPLALFADSLARIGELARRFFALEARRSRRRLVAARKSRRIAARDARRRNRRGRRR